MPLVIDGADSGSYANSALRRVICIENISKQQRYILLLTYYSYFLFSPSQGKDSDVVYFHGYAELHDYTITWHMGP